MKQNKIKWEQPAVILDTMILTYLLEKRTSNLLKEITREHLNTEK